MLVSTITAFLPVVQNRVRIGRLVFLITTYVIIIYRHHEDHGERERPGQAGGR